jgi:hypothetical protein
MDNTFFQFFRTSKERKKWYNKHAPVTQNKREHENGEIFKIIQFRIHK